MQYFPLPSGVIIYTSILYINAFIHLKEEKSTGMYTCARGMLVPSIGHMYNVIYNCIIIFREFTVNY